MPVSLEKTAQAADELVVRAFGVFRDVVVDAIAGQVTGYILGAVVIPGVEVALQKLSRMHGRLLRCGFARV